MNAFVPFTRKMVFDYGALQEVAPNIRRLVAPNPGPLTHHGTNSYVVGRGEVALIDPGPDDPRHRGALLDALGARGERITHIFITHTHLDHCAGLAALAHATGAISLGFGSVGLRQVETLGPSGKSFADTGFAPDQVLRDGDKVRAKEWEIEVLHTPGHAPDHLCLGVPASRALFTGDHVMGWNTSVVAPPEGRMSDYIRSLERLLERDDTLYLPGHGAEIEVPQRLVKAFIVHRRWREAAIAECMKEGLSTIPKIARRVYEGLAPELAKAAELSVLAHLEHLIEQGRAATHGGGAAELDAAFQLL